MINNKNIFITGGAGFIGSSLVGKLLQDNHRVTVMDNLEQGGSENEGFAEHPNLTFVAGDILDEKKLEEVFPKNTDIVVHLASVMGVGYTDDNPLKTIETIVNGTQKVLKHCIKNGAARFIMASSSEVYGENLHGPSSENSPASPKSVYGSAKLTAEFLCKAFHREYGLDHTILRIFNAFGKNQSNNFVIPRFVEKALKGETIEVFGNGDQTRSFCHVSDVTRGIIKIIETDETRNHTYNIGDPGNQISIRDLALKIIDLAEDSSSKVRFVPLESGTGRDPKREIYHRLPDISELMTATGYEPIEDFTEKLLEIINDRKLNYGLHRETVNDVSYQKP